MLRRACATCFAAVLALVGCDGVSPITPDPLGPSGAAVTGIVRDTAGAPIPGVTATVRGTTSSSTTDERGIFGLGGVNPGDRIAVGFAKDGYARTVRYVSAGEGDVVSVDVSMKPLGPPHPIDAAAGGSFADGELRFRVPPLSVASPGVTGNVEVRVAHLDPSGPEITAAPGDTRGTDSRGEDGALASFGMIYVQARQGDRDLSLGRVEIEMPLPADTGADTPLASGDPVPFWVFDDEKGAWIEKGSGRVKPATVDVSRLAFSFETPVTEQWWGNCDQMGRMTCVEGRVVDCAGNAMPGALVRAIGQSYRGTTEASAGPDGRYRLFPVRQSATIRIEAHVTVGGRVYQAAIDGYKTPAGRAPCGVAPDIEVPVPDVIGQVSLGQSSTATTGYRIDRSFAAGGFRSLPEDAGECKPPPPTDDCTVVTTPTPDNDWNDDDGNLPADDQGDWVDAGPYLLLNGPGQVRLRRSDRPPSPYVADELAATLIAAGGGDFDLTALGSSTGMDGFLVRRAVRLPALPQIRGATAGLFASRSADLAVGWDRPPRASTLALMITALDDRNTSTLVCAPTDDGDYVVPASALSRLPAGQATLQLFRVRTRFFPTPNGMAGVGVGSSTSDAKITLQ